MTDLSELIEKVRGATGPDRAIDCQIAVHCAGFFKLPAKWEGGPIGYGYINSEGTEIHPGHGGDQLVRHYTASLDAITDLIEAKLPGWQYGFECRRKANGGATAWVAPNEDARRFNGATPSLALCLAFLRAMETRDE